MHVYFLKSFEYCYGFSMLYMTRRSEGIIDTQLNKNSMPFTTNMYAVMNNYLWGLTNSVGILKNIPCHIDWFLPSGLTF